MQESFLISTLELSGKRSFSDLGSNAARRAPRKTRAGERIIVHVLLMMYHMCIMTERRHHSWWLKCWSCPRESASLLIYDLYGSRAWSTWVAYA